MNLLSLIAIAALNPVPATDGACSTQASTCSSSKSDIVDTAVEAGQFKTLAAALGAAGLVDVLKSEGPFTVFAPSDAAFAKLPKGTVETLLKPENKHQLVDLLKYHVVMGDVMAKAVVEVPGLESLNGQRLAIHVEEGGVSVAGARVVKTDIACSNGVIHVIDTVMMPVRSNLVELAQEAGMFKTLLQAAQAAGLTDTLATGGPFTLLAPSDDAFAKLPEGTLASLLEPANKEKLAAILQLHVISGRAFSDQVVGLQSVKPLAGHELKIHAANGVVEIGGAKVVKVDLQATNGVVHVIDRVLLPR